MDEFGLVWLSWVWLGWKIIRKFLFTLREDDPDENKKSTLNNGESSGSASQLSFTNLFQIVEAYSATTDKIFPPIFRDIVLSLFDGLKMLKPQAKIPHMYKFSITLLLIIYP